MCVQCVNVLPEISPPREAHKYTKTASCAMQCAAPYERRGCEVELRTNFEESWYQAAVKL